MKRVQKAGNSSKKKTGNAKFQQRKSKAQMLLFDSKYSDFSGIMLESSDLSAKLCKNIAPYSAIGDQHLYWMSESYLSDSVQIASGTQNGSYYITLANTQGASDYYGVFDSYRLRAAALEFMPRIDKSLFQPGRDVCPRLWTVIDYDDANTLSVAGLVQYDTVRTTPPGAGIVRAAVPRLAKAAYAGAFTSYTSEDPVWLDIASPNVQHYAFKWAIEMGGTSQVNFQAYALNLRTFWEFKSVR